ncbi:AAA family ATPase [Candidatus Albibeggiatoa sp. nov. NOAA]|uniref:AAA family ATPase n=1 Tax=Candidatus Albibeggiatoa sp. nov. NOAA TaxID=3162724 RepID=UPI0032F21F3C|nr:AAA family ATPase [Thiotrichaceae bacterium]
MLSIQGYTLTEKLFDSAHTQIYRGYRDSDQLPIICKALSNQYPTPRDIARFQREYRLTEKLDHTGFIQAYELLPYKNAWVMILEDIGGKPLSQLMGCYQTDIEYFLQFAIRLTELVGELHQQNIMHKDINPTNIVVNTKTLHIQLIDFEIATELSRETQEVRSPDTLEGNLYYISPEQTGRMNRSIDYRTDYYSLGVTWYQMLTGRLPFEAKDAMEWVYCHIAKTPRPPIEINPQIPYPVSAIIMKLIEKTAEKRYQSTYGLLTDLKRSLEQLQIMGRIDSFSLGIKDASSHFQIHEKLYGRDTEIELLHASFDRVSLEFKEMMLIAGYSGIGKSALVHEVHKPFVKKQGYFISGKFDQFKRNIPYDSLFQAFRGLVRQLLTESEEKIQIWKHKLNQKLHPNGQVLVEVVPEIEQIIGEQPTVPELSSNAARNRFNMVLQNFISSFSDSGQPLVIFLDDLQWADAATLQLLELLMDDDKQKSLFIIGAYRDNEVDEFHPLMLALKNMRRQQATVNVITLAPLALSHVSQLIADSLKTSTDQINQIAQLCWEKTRGNPFFLTQLLHTFHQNKAIEFDVQTGRWRWHLEKMQQAEVSDNVVDLMVNKIQQQCTGSQSVLELAACIGNQFDLRTLSLVYQQPILDTANALWQALQEELILPLGDVYKFVDHKSPEHDVEMIPVYRFIHDRVQQAAYTLIDDAQKAATHLQVGQLLLESSSEQELEERLFEIVNHLNLAENLIHSLDKRKRLAELNLRAGKTAKSAAAYEPALAYLQCGLNLLDLNSWEVDYELSLGLYVHATEAAFLNGDYDQMNQWAELVLQNTTDILDQVKVYEIQIQSFMALNQPLEAVKFALTILRKLKVHFPKRPTLAHILRDFYRSKLTLMGKQVEQLRHLPHTTDPYDLAVMRIMNRIYSAAYIADTHQMILTSIKLTTFSIQHGNCPISAFAYSSYGLILCGVIGDISLGHRFGKLALQVLDDFNANELKCRTYFMVNNFVWHWEAPLRETLDPLLEAYQSGVDTGELEFAGYSAFMYCNYSFFSGLPLEFVEKETIKYVTAIDQIQQQTPLYYNQIVLQTVLNFRGANSRQPWMLIGDAYDETQMLPLHTEVNDITALAFLYVHKMMLCYWFEQYELALEYAEKVDPMGVASMFHSTVFHFYAALSHLALMAKGNKKLRSKHFKRLKNHCKKLKKWAKHAPDNNAHRYALVKAGKAQLAGKTEKALHYYKQAIDLAQQHGYRQEEAVACELYARYWQLKGDMNVAATYIREAFYLYQNWGANSKLDLLKIRYPELNLGMVTKSISTSPNTTISTISTARGSISDLDLISIIKASRGLSEEIQLDSLLRKLVNIVIENAGAQHGMLLLEKNDQWVIEAHSHTQNFTILPSQPLEQAGLPVVPVSLLKYVIQSQKPIILDDAQNNELYGSDAYIQSQYVKSVLCSPVLNQGKLTAIIYLENNLSTGVFTSNRLELIQLLSSQLAISIENAHLYANLEQKVQQRTEKLAQANESIQELNLRLAQENQKLAEARQAALAAAESKSVFLANMSHEIRTPMNAIVGMADILEDTQLNAEQTEYLDTIRSSGNTLLTLINDILDFSKIEAKKLNLEQREFDLRECVENALNLVSAKAAEKQLNLIYFYDDNVPQCIEGDSTRLQQILVNLLSNAVKFTERGEIQVQVQAESIQDSLCQIKFIVQDSGIGIPADRLSSLFKAFTQADSSTTRKYGGTGLGLTISKHLTELMGGHIWVESEVDIGSRFHFSIKAPVTESKPLQALYESHAELQGKSVFLLNLAPNNRLFITQQVERWGMIIAPEISQDVDFAMVELMQDQVPLAEIQSKPLIALTHLCAKQHRQAPFNACLNKPIRPKRLLETFLQLLEQPEDVSEQEAAKQSQQDNALSDAELPEKNSDQLQILLVDDNAVNRKVGVLQLNKLGYQPDTAVDGLDALKALRDKYYDVVLMDMQMPNMDGLEATREIVKNWPTAQCPWIIAMTANAMKEDKERCFAAGMHDYISKPVRGDDLIAALNNVPQNNT